MLQFMKVARFEDITIASSDETIVVEGNHYFPPGSVVEGTLRPSARDYHTVCGWKGTADYFDIVDATTGEIVNEDAAWTYPEAKLAAKEIEGYLAFWKGVEIVDD